jgi:FkbM family methyltransferase
MFTQEEVDVLQSKAKSQLNQDMFVLSELGFKRDGYFVEFGATNGVDLSNTHLLEKEMGWTGILAEPAKIWSEDLAKNRNCHIDYDCVWSKSGEVLEFNEVNAAELSTIDTFSSVDRHAATRTSGTKYPVNTISLLDLLKKYDAPKVIDYLSIDTEGSEFEILNAFDFDAYKFKVITCEHNFTPMRDKIYDLLTSKGYTRKFTNLSKFDDWYVL